MKARRWDFVSAHASFFGVQRICRVLQVSRSGYYRWPSGAKARAVRQVSRLLRGRHRDWSATTPSSYRTLRRPACGRASPWTG